MKKNKSLIFFIVLFAFVGYFIFTNIKDAIELRNQYKTVSIRFEGDGITKKKLNDCLRMEKEKKEKNTPKITAYNRLESGEIKNKQLHRKLSVSIMEVSGDMMNVAPMNLSNGNYVYSEDKKGCIIDSKSAYELFGTVNIMNNKVIYKGKEYNIRGVVKTSFPVFMIQGKEDTTEYMNLELYFMSSNRAEDLSVEFINKYQLPNKYIVIDSGFFESMTHSVLLLPIWILYFAIILIVIRYFRKERIKGKKKYAIAVGVVIATVSLILAMSILKLTGNPFSFMMKYIPTKWSDFDFWSRQYNLIVEQLKKIQYMRPNPKDDILVESIKNAFYRFIIIHLLYLIGYFYYRLFQNSQIEIVEIDSNTLDKVTN